MPSLFLLLLELYLGRIVTHVEAYLLSPQNFSHRGFSSVLTADLYTHRGGVKGGPGFLLNSSHSDPVNSAVPSYCYSEHYKRLSSYFSADQKELEDREYGPIKDKYVRFDEQTGTFAPATYTIGALLAVPELFQENFLRRGEDHWHTLMQIRTTNENKLRLLEQIKNLKALRAQRSKLYFSNSDPELRESNISLRNEIKDLNARLELIFPQLLELKNTLPNLLSPEVQSENIVVGESGTFERSRGRRHFEVVDILSPDYVERGVGISGRGFSAYSGNIARLSRALVNFMLDTLTRVFNYSEVNVPAIVSKSTLKRTAHLPRFEEHLFRIDSRSKFDGEEGYLIPTSEVPLLALHKNLRLRSKELPLWFTAYSECFRSEIQDYGLDTRGLIRQHQFGKVEVLCLSGSHNSDYNHQLMLTHIEFILNALELPFRKVLLSDKETSSTSSKTIDFEVYFPALDTFVEVSSCSNTRDYQTNNLNILTTSRDPVHSINGSALAIGRTLSALLENNCKVRANGLLEVRIPKALQPYLNEESVILQEPR